MTSDQFNKALKKKGIKKNFIAECLGVSNSLVTLWVQDKLRIAEKHLPKLKAILK